jgi:hypothetical protein
VGVGNNTGTSHDHRAGGGTDYIDDDGGLAEALRASLHQLNPIGSTVAGAYGDADESNGSPRVDVDGATKGMLPPASSTASIEWVCPSCTFINAPTERVCSMCETPHPT